MSYEQMFAFDAQKLIHEKEDVFFLVQLCPATATGFEQVYS